MEHKLDNTDSQSVTIQQNEIQHQNKNSVKIEENQDTREVSQIATEKQTSQQKSLADIFNTLNIGANKAQSETVKNNPEDHVIGGEESKVVVNVPQDKLEDVSDGVQTVRVAVLGNVDSGKSTLTSILSSTPNTLDDGRGSARTKVFNFKHEIENGRSTSLGHEIMGFDKNGQQVFPASVTKGGTNSVHAGFAKKKKIWPEIVRKSTKVIQMVDLCGHERYLKTTVYGLSSNQPNYCLLVLGANMGVQRMTKEHLGLAMMGLRIPVIVVLTKVDICPQNKFDQTLSKIRGILRNNCSLNSIVVKSQQDLDFVASGGSQICPVFCVSNVTGDGIELLRNYMSTLTIDSQATEQINELSLTRKNSSQTEKSNLMNRIDTEFVIDGVYNVKGIGTVFGGLMKKGTLELNQICMFGPDKNGNFKMVQIKSIQLNRVDKDVILEGQSVTVLVKAVGTKAKEDTQIKSKNFRKGMVIINQIPVTQQGAATQKYLNMNQYNDVCSREFDAEVQILHNPSTLKIGSQLVMHSESIAQACRLTKIYSSNNNSKDYLCPNDRALVKLRFLMYPEFIQKGGNIILRDGRIIGLGKITRCFNNDNTYQGTLNQAAQ